jgi:hypothetical protein
MIVPNIESTINGVLCRFSNKSVEAFHLVYDDNGHAIVMEFAKTEVGTKHNLFSCTDFEEFKSEIHAQGVYYDEQTFISEKIKELLLP